MRKILEFLDRIHSEMNLIHGISENNSEVQDNCENSKRDFVITQNDVFVYFSEDLKGLSTTWGDFDPRKKFSFLVYFSYVIYKSTNGGLIFIGFYDSNYKKVENFKIGHFIISKCNSGCNFENRKNPTFYFELKHEYGNKHNSLRCGPDSKSCQIALDSIWELDYFYRYWQYRFMYSPKPVPEIESPYCPIPS